MPELQYVALYPEAILFLTRSGDCDALSVLIALIEHADGFGGCDPGDERLGKRSGHRRDAIPALLERLQAVDYIRIIETYVPYRTKPLRGFKINPYVIRLRTENQATAMAEWKRFDLQTNAGNEKQTTSITFPSNDQQPDQNQNQTLNQLQNQLQKQQQTSERETPSDKQFTHDASGVDQKPSESEGQKPEQDEETHDGTDTRSATGRTAPASAPLRREPVSLVPYRRPLADESDENLALDMVNLAGDLSRENARMLVDTYGWEQVSRVMQIYYRSKSVASPGRWLRSMLRKLDREEQRG